VVDRRLREEVMSDRFGGGGWGGWLGRCDRRLGENEVDH